jgi:hypothetical protein
MISQAVPAVADAFPGAKEYDLTIGGGDVAIWIGAVPEPPPLHEVNANAENIIAIFVDGALIIASSTDSSKHDCGFFNA